MIWKEELELIDQLLKRLANLGADIARQVTQAESRQTTLGNEIARLDADYRVLQARNEQAKLDFKKSMRLDLEQLQEDKRRTNQREVALIEKEKELHKLKSELEAELAVAKQSRQSAEALGRSHVRK